MAEIGGATIAEMQPKPTGVVEKVKGKLREFFTPQGRAEVMAQKQMDTILAQVAPEDRVKAMEHLEKMRPDLVAGKMEDAKGSLVRDAVIGAAAAGTVAVGLGVGYWQRDNINKKAGEVGMKIFGKLSESERGRKVLSGFMKVTEAKANVDMWVGNIRKNLRFPWADRKAMSTPPPVTPTAA